MAGKESRETFTKFSAEGLIFGNLPEDRSKLRSIFEGTNTPAPGHLPGIGPVCGTAAQ